MSIISTMTLDDWLWSQHLRQNAFAVRIGIGQSYLNEIVRGKKLPSLLLALKIMKETEGAVRPEDFASNGSEAVP